MATWAEEQAGPTEMALAPWVCMGRRRRMGSGVEAGQMELLRSDWPPLRRSYKRPGSLGHTALNLHSRSPAFAEVPPPQGTGWGRVTGEPSSSPSGPTRHPGMREVCYCDFRLRERVSPRPQGHLLPAGWLVPGMALQNNLPQKRGLAKPAAVRPAELTAHTV